MSQNSAVHEGPARARGAIAACVSGVGPTRLCGHVSSFTLVEAMRIRPVFRGVLAAIVAFVVQSPRLLLAEAEESNHSSPGGAPPGEAAIAGRALSLSDALALGQERAAGVLVGRRSIREAQARDVGAGVILPVNPRLLADARPPVTGAGWRDLGYSVTGEVSFETGGAADARRREAGRAVAVAGKSLELARLDARRRAWEAYVVAKIAQRRLDEARALGEVARRVLDATRRRGDLGAGGDIEQSTAALDVALLRAAEEDGRRRLAAGMMELRDALDLSVDEELVLTTTLDEPPPAPPAALLVDRALRRSADLAAIRSRRDLLGATDERLAREAYPRLGLYGGVDAAPLSPVFGVAGLSLELPIAQYNQGARARVARERETESERLDIEGRRLVREVVAARAAYESRRDELAVLEGEALPAAERAYRLIETGWNLGRFDVFRVTTAARDLGRLRSQALDALEGAWLQRAELDRAVGGGL